jgi:biopolymer transport protein ExbD
MKIGPRRQSERTVSVDITPMMDMVFLLIIFFMTTAQFVRMTRADVDLPLEPGEQEPEPDEPGIVINVMRDGSMIVADQDVTLDGLRDIMRREINAQPQRRADRVKLLIRADRELRGAQLNRLVGALQEMGVGFGRFATEVPQ